MDEIEYYAGILQADSDRIPGLNDLTFPLTPQSQANSNAMTHESQEDLSQVQPTEVGGARSAQKVLSHRSKKFDQEEDKVICAAWLGVSKDPIHGANQRQATFWGRVRAYFDEHKKTEIARTENSIMHRWMTIQKEVNKFCSAYDKILRRNASGKTIQDMINDALETYTGDDEEHKKFAFIHCWYKLKDEDKWKSWRIEQGTKPKTAAPKKKKAIKDSMPSTGAEKNTDEVPDAGSAERKRPPGQMEAKKARWGGNDACIVVLDKMMEKKEARDKERDKAREASAQADKASIEVEKKLAEATLMKEEKDIMLADTSSLDADQLQWIQIMRKKILARHTEN